MLFLIDLEMPDEEQLYSAICEADHIFISDEYITLCNEKGQAISYFRKNIVKLVAPIEKHITKTRKQEAGKHK
jgi:hypothetical protein